MTYYRVDCVQIENLGREISNAVSYNIIQSQGIIINTEI